ncbi:MAG: GDP-mannose 4,6-dehydratase [Actinomycetota bacterium]
MNIIITGAGGFVGKHLTGHLQKDNHRILGIDINTDAVSPEIESRKVDLTRRHEIETLIRDFKPDQVYHLAAQSSVSYSWAEPIDTFRINVFGGINLLNAVRQHSPRARILAVCTAEEYGPSKDGEAISEDFNIFPQNPYAISKAALDFFSLTYSKAYSMNVFVTRSFNHIGPGQSERFVASDFARQIASIEQGLAGPVIKVGNLEAYRDFLDVRDVVAAYSDILERGNLGRPYNVCSGKKTKIEHILDTLIGFSSKRKQIRVEADKEKFRPIDVISIYGDNSKLKKDTGWRPKYDLETSLFHTLEWWRERVKRKERSKK